MKKKRIVIFLIALNLILLSIFMINTKTYADEQISVIAETNSSMEQGSSAYCYVKISSLENVSSINISVYFDSDKIEVMNTYNQVSASLYDSSINEDKVNYSYIFDGNGETTETSLFYFYYKVKDDSVLGNTYFDIIVTDALNSSLNELNVKGNRCNINVIEKKVSKTCYVYNNENSINTKIGQEFDVKYYFSTHDIASGSMNITYDYDLFELKNYSFGHFFDEKIKDINTNLNGSIYISFLGTEINYNTDIITLTFIPKKNVNDLSIISISVTDLYDNDLNNIICSSTDISINLSKDESYIEDAPRVYLNASMQNNNSQCLLTIKLDEKSNLGAGDFNITFDTNYLAYNSSTKILSATYFNVNDKKKDEGIIKFSIISLENISSETDVLTILFDINPICSDQLVDFDITASGLSDSLTNPIMLNMIGLSYELVSNGHNYGEPTFVWDGYTAKAIFTCQHDDDHIVELVATITNEITTNPTCEATGIRKYTAKVTFNDIEYSDYKEETLEAIGHSYGDWSITTAPTLATKGLLIKVCQNDNNHTLTYELPMLNKDDYTYSVVTSPKCETTGKGSYKITVDNQEFTFEVITDALGHAPLEAVNENIVPATCENGGHYDLVVYCNECGKELSRQTITVTKLGHNYGTVTYSWNNDECTATRVCQNDNNHIETETVKGSYVKVNDATCTLNEIGKYVATFINQAFDTQESSVFEVANTKLSHNYGTVTYTWNNDECTATRVCQNDNNHIETEIVKGTYVKVSNATCILNETGKYVATFTNEAFESQETSVFEVTDSMLGHNYGEPAFVWNDYTAKAIFTCKNDNDHKEEIIATITNEITKEATVEENGIKTYTATIIYNGKTYTSTKEEIIAKLDPIVEYEKVINSLSKDDGSETIQKKLEKANYLYSLIENKESVKELHNTYDEYQRYYEESIKQTSNNGLNGGVIAGIIAGSIAIISAIAVGGYFILKKKKSS